MKIPPDRQLENRLNVLPNYISDCIFRLSNAIFELKNNRESRSSKPTSSPNSCSPSLNMARNNTQQQQASKLTLKTKKIKNSAPLIKPYTIQTDLNRHTHGKNRPHNCNDSKSVSKLAKNGKENLTNQSPRQTRSLFKNTLLSASILSVSLVILFNYFSTTLWTSEEQNEFSSLYTNSPRQKRSSPNIPEDINSELSNLFNDHLENSLRSVLLAILNSFLFEIFRPWTY